MADLEAQHPDDVEWTIEQDEESISETVGRQDGPVFVAMQPGVDIPAGVEVQEVVIVAEGSEQIQEVSQGNESIQQQSILTIGNVDDFSTRHREAPKIRIKKRHLAEYLSNSVPPPPVQYKKSPFRGRPRGSKNYKTAHHSRSTPILPPPPPPIKQESQTSSDDSDDDTEEEEEGPPRKKPKPREFAHRLQWRNKDMLDAMKAVEEKRYTIRGAAKKFGVPYSTLKDRVHGRVRHGTKPGVKTVLSPEEEEELVRYVRDMESAGFQMKCLDVRDRAAEMLRLNHGHNTPYKEGSPGHNWLAGFLKRHPGLEFKRSVSRNVVPSLTKQKQMVRRFFDITSQVYKKYKMNHKSDRVFAVSELRLTGAIDATILYAASADGVLVPPFVIFRGRALKLTSARQSYPEAFFTCCYDGKVNEDSFLWWYRDHFMKHAASNTKPTVLFIARSIQDITLQLVQHAKEERVHLVCMPRGVQHLMQPLDYEINETIRSMINKRIRKWEEENPGTAYTQKVIAQILSKVWKKISHEDIVAKFQQNGLFPLNVHAISNERIVSASHLLRETYNAEQHDAASGSSPLSGLNLLSALSSHEYASIDQIYSGNGAHNQSFEQESDNSFSNMETPKQHEKRNPIGRVLVKVNQKQADNSLEDGIEMDVSEDNLEDNIIEEPVEIGEEIVAQEIISEIPTEEDVKNILEHQHHFTKQKRKPRPTTDILRNTDVQSEIAAARKNKDQINRAIDSILDMENSKQLSIGPSVSGKAINIGDLALSTNIKQEHVPKAETRITTLRLVDGKLVDGDGNIVELGQLDNGGMQIELKTNSECDGVQGFVEEHMVAEDMSNIVEMHDDMRTEEAVINNTAQINELINSGAVQGLDVNSVIVSTEEPQYEEEPQYVQVYESVQSELPQQILQSEEPQTIVLDQNQLHQLLLEGGEVLTEEQVVEQAQQQQQCMVEYVQLADGTIQEVILE